MSEQLKARQRVALERLKQQLDNGTKKEKGTGELIPLTKKDISRIKSEIKILEERTK